MPARSCNAAGIFWLGSEQATKQVVDRAVEIDRSPAAPDQLADGVIQFQMLPQADFIVVRAAEGPCNTGP